MPAYERIVSLAPSNTEILYALGVEDRIAATTALCDYPPAAVEKPSIGGWTNPDINAVTEHNPDLVLASDELQDDAVQQCRDAGLTVKQVTPTRFQDVFNTVKAIGEWMDREEAARELVDEMNEQVSDLVTPQLNGPRIYCEEWRDPPMVGGNWIPDIVQILGGQYLIDGGTRSREVTADEIRQFDPEYIFLHYCGYGDDADASQVMNREGWQEITAVENEDVYVVDDSCLNRPTPRLLDGMERIQRQIRQDL